MIQTNQPLSEIMNLPYWKFEEFIIRLNKKNEEEQKEIKKQQKQQNEQSPSSNKMPKIPKYKIPNYK